ncbi:MAG: DUF3305 domain-containing protein [Polaromonas sp.]|uniref:DUF3305 domain-containing protein n=1 Tax=Polaromonas sp. TaxID=1869339 RepID=UPI00273681D3|nr:DUF3305 domain-containing protein [Polaromonas sp.]MDP2819717.1 DUF3305 domain-containing protein [Polaromonas sp.]
MTTSGFLLQSPPEEGVQRPCVEVAVLMRRERIDNRWQPWRWSLADIVPQEDGFGAQPRLLLKDANEERWLHPGFKVELFTDDAEGYYLNVSTSQPCFWVVWRMEEEAALADEPVAVPQIVTLSYHDAGRWLDAQETVEQVAAPRDVVEWVQAFVDAHYVLEAKRRQRPQSFKSLQDRFGNPARVSTDKTFGGGGHG